MLRSILASVIALNVFSPALANTPADASNAVVMVAVRGKDADGTNVERYGTGFVVATSSYVVTAFHVVAPPPKGWGKKDFDFPDVTIAIRFRDLQTGLMTEVRRAHVHRFTAEQDAAVLQFDGLPRKGLSTCPAAEPTIPGTPLVIAGVPNTDGFEVPKLELNPGLLQEARAQDQGRRRIAGQTMPGFSGGPVFVTGPDGVLQPVGILKGGQSFGAASQSLYVPLALLRGSLLAHCTVPCRDESHGIERFDRDDLGAVQTSDWLRGGSTSEAYCGAHRSSEMNAHPGVTITIEKHGDVEQRFFTGMRDGAPVVREAQYKYFCQLRYRSGPTYKLVLSAKCPAPPNPGNLPN